MTFDEDYKNYNSVEEFYNDTKINILYPEGMVLEANNSITYYFRGTSAEVIQHYSESVLIMLYMHQSPYNKDILSLQDNIKQYEFNGRVSYLIQKGNEQLYVLFDNNYTYTISAPDEQTAQRVIKKLKYIKEL